MTDEKQNTIYCTMRYAAKTSALLSPSSGAKICMAAESQLSRHRLLRSWNTLTTVKAT